MPPHGGHHGGGHHGGGGFHRGGGHGGGGHGGGGRFHRGGGGRGWGGGWGWGPYFGYPWYSSTVVIETPAAPDDAIVDALLASVDADDRRDDRREEDRRDDERRDRDRRDWDRRDRDRRDTSRSRRRDDSERDRDDRDDRDRNDRYGGFAVLGVHHPSPSVKGQPFSHPEDDIIEEIEAFGAVSGPTLQVAHGAEPWAPDANTWNAIAHRYSNVGTVKLIPRRSDPRGQSYAFRAVTRGEVSTVLVDETETKASIAWLIVHELCHQELQQNPKKLATLRARRPAGLDPAGDRFHQVDPEERTCDDAATRLFGNRLDRAWWRARVNAR